MISSKKSLLKKKKEKENKIKVDLEVEVRILPGKYGHIGCTVPRFYFY